MPRGQQPGHGRITGARHTSLPLRAAVIVMHSLYNERFQDIEVKLGVKSSTASQIYRHAQETAGSTELHALLEALEPTRNPGRPPLAPDGSDLSYQIRTICYEDCYSTWDRAVHNAGIKMARSTIEIIAKRNHDREHPNPLVRSFSVLKPKLDADLRDLRLEFSRWALHQLDQGALFIFSDETYINLGGHPHKKRRFTRMKGETSETSAIYDESTKFSLMFWGACCEDISVQRPYLIWESETEEESRRAALSLKQENEQLKQEA